MTETVRKEDAAPEIEEKRQDCILPRVLGLDGRFVISTNSALIHFTCKEEWQESEDEAQDNRQSAAQDFGPSGIHLGRSY